MCLTTSNITGVSNSKQQTLIEKLTKLTNHNFTCDIYNKRSTLTLKN